MPGTTRTSANETAKWESSRAVARGVSSSVAERRARALGKDTARSTRKPPPSKDPTELTANALGLLWILFGGLVIVMCMVFVVGSVVMFGVLHEISDARNYDDAARQVAAYEEFFKSAVAGGFQVTDDKPNIQDGVTKYLWTVQPPNDGPLRVFSWQHDLEDNKMRPTSNAAALLDIELGYITAKEAEEYSRRSVHQGRGKEDTTRQVYRFSQSDPVTNAIIDRNASAFAKNSGNGWGQATVIADSAPPLPPPLFDPKASRRKGAGVALAEEEPEEDPTEGEVEEEAAEPVPAPEEERPEPEPPTEVQPEPPADDDEGGADPSPEEPAPGTDPDDDSGEATPVR